MICQKNKCKVLMHCVVDAALYTAGALRTEKQPPKTGRSSCALDVRCYSHLLLPRNHILFLPIDTLLSSINQLSNASFRPNM